MLDFIKIKGTAIHLKLQEPTILVYLKHKSLLYGFHK